MTHHVHRSAPATCKRPCPRDTRMVDTSRRATWSASSELAIVTVRARRRRRRPGHG